MERNIFAPFDTSDPLLCEKWRVFRETRQLLLIQRCSVLLARVGCVLQRQFIIEQNPRYANKREDIKRDREKCVEVYRDLQDFHAYTIEFMQTIINKRDKLVLRPSDNQPTQRLRMLYQADFESGHFQEELALWNLQQLIQEYEDDQDFLERELMIPASLGVQFFKASKPKPKRRV